MCGSKCPGGELGKRKTFGRFEHGGGSDYRTSSWGNGELSRFLSKNISASPWVGAEPNKKVTNYAQQNVATAFGFAQKLTQAKDLQDLVRIQTEFLQTQIQSLTEQAKELRETATKAVAGTLKGPSS